MTDNPQHVHPGLPVTVTPPELVIDDSKRSAKKRRQIVMSCDTCAHATKSDAADYPFKCGISKPIPMYVHKFCVSWFGYVGCASHTSAAKPKRRNEEMKETMIEVTGRVVLKIPAKAVGEAEIRFKQIILSCDLKSNEILQDAVPHTFEVVGERDRRLNAP